MAPATSESAPTSEVRVLSTLNGDGSRRWLKPKLSTGRFLTARRFVAYGLIAFFTVVPHLRIGGKPPILIDIAAREFTFVGTTLYPTDTLLLTLLILSVFLSIFLLTAIAGRVWCGWACPQTVYLEFVYRPIERLLEGVPGRRAKQGAWRTPLKLVIYFVISFVLAHTFVAYFVPTDELFKYVTGSPLAHPAPFLVVVIVTGMMMFDFSFFREQLCIVACPYGRFQSVMLDRGSLIVGYDKRRGEPRGRAKRPAKVDLTIGETTPPEPVANGDCIDCTLCVQTCPTGIDIRDGLQLECVNCTQCIDACDAVMDKIGKPRGLIRYASQASLDGEKTPRIRPRTLVYPALLTVIAAAFVTLLVTRTSAMVNVLRGPGLPFQVMQDGTVASPIKVKIHDRTPTGASYTVALAPTPGHEGGAIESTQLPIVLEAGELKEVPMLLRMPVSAFQDGKCPITIVISDGEGFEKEVRYLMLGPAHATTTPSSEAPTDGN